MRIVFIIIKAAITVALCIMLSADPAPLGRLLSPQHGIWQNAEPSNVNFSENLTFNTLQGKTEVYFDERLVPHVFAEHQNDAYFVQGYLHAKFRLFQMDLQTKAAGGRASEMVGEIALNHDREFRRLGMQFAAENSLRAMENDPVVKGACDAYTAGVNQYINSLSKSQWPIEYKLLNLAPEKWSNLRTALFLKYMSHQLAGHEDDFEMSASKSFFSPTDFKTLFPDYQDSVDPIIPTGTTYPAPQVKLIPQTNYDSVSQKKLVANIKSFTKPDPANGSNNWAVAPSKTMAGAPILCNDPHLGLSLPSLWYEIQISTPDYNTYGVSFPGAPSVIIGYNDSIAWGVTNGGRDVRDYYEIKFKDETRQQYWFDSAWQPTQFRYEQIKIKGRAMFFDTVAYTVFGPVMYDKNFGTEKNINKKNYAVTWTAHNAGKELMTFMLLDKAKNYTDYLDAVKYMHTPGQNFAFISKNGDIAMRTQGAWPAKWKGQGDFIMPGEDSSYMWQGIIPFEETPYQYNPERAFVSSANQRPADSTYPYYLGRRYPVTRGALINRMLTAKQNITSQDMMDMQNNNYNIFAEWAMPVLRKHIQTSGFTEVERSRYADLTGWNFNHDINSNGATIFEVFWKKLYELIYNDEFERAPAIAERPMSGTMLEGLLQDSSYKFIDDVTTARVETLPDIMTSAFRASVDALNEPEFKNRLAWGKYKDTRVKHLLKLEPLSRMHLPIGGGADMINATKEEHGPSWRMIVNLTKETEAFGVYPGGQSGNPGSKFYDTFIDSWAAGKYYQLWLMKRNETSDARIKWTMKFSKS